MSRASPLGRRLTFPTLEFMADGSASLSGAQRAVAGDSALTPEEVHAFQSMDAPAAKKVRQEKLRSPTSIYASARALSAGSAAALRITLANAATAAIASPLSPA